jgi:hypothetical protein
MSKVAISGNASGTGVFTIASPNSNTDRTLSLPDQTGTLLTGSGALNINASAPTSSLTLDASGNLGVGTTSPANRLSIGAGSFASATSQTTGMYTNGTSGLVMLSDAYSFNSRTGSGFMNIDSSGNLLVGKTSGSRRLDVDSNSGTTAVARFGNTTASGNVSGIETSLESNGNNTSSYHFRGVTQNIGIWYLYGNGTSSFTSDQRLKKNIATARGGYLDDLMQLRVVKYQWKNNDDDSVKELGLIAQEVEQVFPGLVQDSDVQFDGVTPKVLKGSVLPFMLLKAIQELKADLDATKAELAALKGQA